MVQHLFVANDSALADAYASVLADNYGSAQAVDLSFGAS
jgi:hypothetical protein